MAESPSHRFGQIIGEVLERAVEPLLARFARQHGLYLDRKGPRPARRGSKVAWIDLYQNTHDLDFVLERDGTAERRGRPVAFIETAWRRYTKHSRNKAQEIQGAILPLAEAHRHATPFIGVILAGDFTDGALAQLRSHRFAVVHFSAADVIRAFAQGGVNAEYDEATTDAEFARRVAAWNKLPTRRQTQVAQALVRVEAAQVEAFIRQLERVVARRVESVHVVPLHGTAHELPTVAAAIAVVANYAEGMAAGAFVHYEIQVRFNDSSRVEGRFPDKDAAVGFLRSTSPE